MSTRFFPCNVVLAREPVSFWREKMIAVVSLPSLSENSGGNKLLKCKKFYYFAIGRELYLPQHK